MNNQKNFIDLALTPKNSEQKGYKYIDDVIYDIYKPSDSASTKDIFILINQHGYKLGLPSESKEVNIYYGLYMPIENKNTK